MKQKIYFLGMGTTITIFLGALFKINHWPAAGILLTLGLTTLVLVFFPLAIYDSYRAAEKKKPLLHFITWLTTFVIFTSMLFKLMHWPNAGLFLLIALPFPYVVFLPVFIISNSRDKDFRMGDLVAVLMLLAMNSVFAGLLALNVSRERIDDSLNLARNSIAVESNLNLLPKPGERQSLNRSIDEVIKVIDEYQASVLNADFNTPESWRMDPENLNRPDAKGIASAGLIEAGEPEFGTELANALQGFIDDLSKEPGLEELTRAAPVILGFKTENGDPIRWAIENFSESSLSWTMIYLQGLKTDLMTIKASLI